MNRRVLALDISTEAIGMAWGEAGKLPERTACWNKRLGQSEIWNLHNASEYVNAIALTEKIGIVIFSEFYFSPSMISFRAQCSMRGAVMAALYRENRIEALPVAEITARKAAGVDISKCKPTEIKKGYMKRRVADLLKQHGLNLDEDEADAAILLLGANSVLEIG